jgi:uncharacterized protein (DUF1697 family)
LRGGAVRFVAFLRGINVGGRKPVKMEELRAAFSALGFRDVRTIQASGTVVFEAPDEAAGGADDAAGVADEPAGRIGAGLERSLGYPVRLMVRPVSELEALVESEPFAGVRMSPATRLYVTFLSSPVGSGTELGLDRDERINLVRITGREVLTAIELAPGWGTTELMAWLEKTFGRDVTTRNWNTILKIVGR